MFSSTKAGITQSLLISCLFWIFKVTQASSILFSGGTVIAFDQSTEGLQVLRNYSVLVVEDRVSSIFPDSTNTTIPSGTENIDITGMIMSPGFIDTHRHGWQTGFKTIASNTSLPEYFHRYGEFASAGLLTPEDVYIGQLAGLLETQNAGTTTVLDHAHGSWNNETAEAGLNGSFDCGSRVFHAQVIHDLTNGFTIEDQIAELLSMSQDPRLKNGSVSLGLAYDGFSTDTTDVVNSVIDAAKEANVSVVTTHLLGGPWDYTNSPELLNSYNFLNISTPVVFSHASYMTVQGAELLRSTNQYIATTPESELQYGHGHPQTYLSQDQAALGVDTHFTYSADIITQARIWLQSVRNTLYSQVLANWNIAGPNPMSANQAFLLATRNGGLALRRQDLGIIAEGAKADLVIFDGDSPGLLGWVDPVAAVILHSHVGDIQHVLVDGKFVKRDGKLTYPDYAGVQQRFLNSARRIQAVWKGIPYPVLEGQYGSIAAYQDPKQEDVLRGEGTGYGTLFV